MGRPGVFSTREVRPPGRRASWSSATKWWRSAFPTGSGPSGHSSTSARSTPTGAALSSCPDRASWWTRSSAWLCWRATSMCGGATSEAANDSPPNGGNVNTSNVELLAQAFAGWGKDNPANMRDVLHPDCELVVPDSIPYGGTFRGADAAIGWFTRELWRWFDEFTSTPEGFIDGGDQIVVPVHVQTRAKNGKAIVWIYEFSESKLVRGQVYADTANLRDAVERGRHGASTCLAILDMCRLVVYMKTTTIRVPSETRDRLNELARRRGAP